MDTGLLTLKEARDMLHVSTNTLYNWERNGLLTPYRTEGGHRRYERTELLKAIGASPKREPRLTIGYCRVSSAGQKQDLECQVQVVTNYCEKQGYQFRIIQDVGSGLNYKRLGFTELIKCVCKRECSRIVVNYKDRLVRFGFEMLNEVCALHNVEIEVINTTDDMSMEDELVKDVLSIITVFSSRLYGKRSHKNKRIIEESRRLFQGGVGNDERSSGTEEEDQQNSEGTICPD